MRESNRPPTIDQPLAAGGQRTHIRHRRRRALMIGLAVSAGAVTGVGLSAPVTSAAASPAPLAASLPAAFPPRANSAWVYDGKGVGTWAATISSYNQVATANHALTQLYNYGSDLECGGASASGATCGTDQKIGVFYNQSSLGTSSTAAYYSDFDLAPNIASGSTTETMSLSPIIDGRTDADGYLQGFNGLSATLAGTYADQVAAQVCAESHTAGIQFDIEPFDLSAQNGQYFFYLQLAKDFAGKNTGVAGCVTAAYPSGRYFSVFTFAAALKPGTASATNTQTVMTTYHNGYVIDSLYDLGPNPGGSLNDVPTYTSLVSTEANSMQGWADAAAVPYAYGIPASASAHEYTTCVGTCQPGKDGSTGNPMLSYTKAAVAAINAAHAPTDPLFIGTDIWDLGASTTSGTSMVAPAPAPADVWHWLATNLPGSTATSGSTPDTSPPSQPTGVTVTSTSASSVSLSWTASTDNVGVTGYDVLNGAAVAVSTSGTTAVVNGLAPDTSYTFTVRAKDAAGNTSTPSAPVTGRTAAQASNLLTNPGFETGTFSGWTCTTGTAVATGQAATGTYSAALTPSDTTTATCSQSVSVTAGHTYTLSAQLKSSSGAYIYVGGTGYGSAFSTAGSYQLQSVMITPTSTSLTVYVQAYKQQTGSTYADDVSLTAN